MNGLHEKPTNTLLAEYLLGDLSHDIMRDCERMRAVRTGDLLEYEL